MMGIGSLILLILVTFIAYITKVHPDYIVVLLPTYVDGYFVRALYPRDRKNTGATKIPFVARLSATDMTFEELGTLLTRKESFPVLVKNVVNIDQEMAIMKLKECNAGKNIRLISYEDWETPAFSPSCNRGDMTKKVTMPFDEYAERFLSGENAKIGSYWYAGFEAITNAKDLTGITGRNWTSLGDYKQNNMFVSNFPHEILTAPMHGAPIDSMSVQLFGTKTWYFVSPEDLSALPNIPMPTCFNLPMTDDELLSKLKNVVVVKQEPGDLIYFGPHWAHVVSTSAGPNMMFNFRFNNLDKIRSGPMSLLWKLAYRNKVRGFGGLPQDNMVNHPIIYKDLNGYYPECGFSEAFAKVIKQGAAGDP